MQQRHAKKALVCLAVGVVALTPMAAMAQQSGGIFGMIGFFNQLFQDLQEFFGYLLALMGIIAMGFGVWNVVQHFRVESRDDPNQKSRLVFGLVSFLCGIFLAGGAYQQIGTETEFSAGSYTPAPIVQELNRIA
jgi:type IV secretory pathway VirB2 component (pilin)